MAARKSGGRKKKPAPGKAQATRKKRLSFSSCG